MVFSLWKRIHTAVYRKFINCATAYATGVSPSATLCFRLGSIACVCGFWKKLFSTDSAIRDSNQARVCSRRRCSKLPASRVLSQKSRMLAQMSPIPSPVRAEQETAFVVQCLLHGGCNAGRCYTHGQPTELVGHYPDQPCSPRSDLPVR